MNRLLLTLLSILLVSILLLSMANISKLEPPEGFLFGVTYGQETAHEAILLIDRVKTYTNFFMVASWPVIINETALTQVCDHAAKSGLSFIVFFDFICIGEYGYTWHDEWILNAKDRWGDKFLGVYIYEEPGGKQIETGLFDEFAMDPVKARMYENVTTYSEAAEVFVTELPATFSFEFLIDNNVTRFVSDYALYWFDYLAGYDTVFVELGWGHNPHQHIALGRGAATAQNKTWGTILTWKHAADSPETIKTASEMREDMFTSYEAGAKYVIVFNFPRYPEDNVYGVLTDEHFTVMEQFWKHACTHPEEYGKTTGQTAFVLPKDYGWAMRDPHDNIWGLWPADNLSLEIRDNMNTLVDRYGLQLDIVYDDPRFSYENYDEIYFYNSTIE